MDVSTIDNTVKAGRFVDRFAAPPCSPGYFDPVNDVLAVIDAALWLLDVGRTSGAAAPAHRDAWRRCYGVGYGGFTHLGDNRSEKT